MKGIESLKIVTENCEIIDVTQILTHLGISRITNNMIFSEESNLNYRSCEVFCLTVKKTKETERLNLFKDITSVELNGINYYVPWSDNKNDFKENQFETITETENEYKINIKKKTDQIYYMQAICQSDYEISDVIEYFTDLELAKEMAMEYLTDEHDTYSVDIGKAEFIDGHLWTNQGTRYTL